MIIEFIESHYVPFFSDDGTAFTLPGACETKTFLIDTAKIREPKVLSREQELEALQREFLAAKAAHAEATRAMIEAREKLIAFS